MGRKTHNKSDVEVTILILIDGFLQSFIYQDKQSINRGHNPYFNRWFSAIPLYLRLGFYNSVTILILIDGFLQ